MARIILGSGSPRRQELLRRIGIEDFIVRVPDVEEWYPPELSPAEIVRYISREKADAVPCDPGDIVITADTMVFLDTRRLGKPRDEADALEMLAALQGRHHTAVSYTHLDVYKRQLWPEPLQLPVPGLGQGAGPFLRRRVL